MITLLKSLLKLLCGIVVFVMVLWAILLVPFFTAVIGILAFVPAYIIAFIIMIFSAIIAFVLNAILTPFGYSIGAIDFNTAMVIGAGIGMVFFVVLLVLMAMVGTEKLFEAFEKGQL